MTRSSYHAWCGVIGRVLPKPEALMREALSETLPVRIATGEIRAYLPVSSDEGMAAGSGTSQTKEWRQAAEPAYRKSMPPIRVPMRMSRDYLYDFTLIFRWSTFSSTVNLCNINCVICSDTHSSFGPPIVAQSMSCEGVHDHENGVSKLT